MPCGHEGIGSLHRYEEESQACQIIVDESNHNGAEQESLSEQKRFVQMEITLKNRGYMPSGVGIRLIHVVRQAGRQADKNLVYNIFTSNRFSDF